MFELFTKFFNKAVNNHAPLRQASSTEKCLKSKPLLTSGVLKSVKTKKHLFLKFVKTDSTFDYVQYKTYRNASRIECSKRNHYHEILEKNKSDCEKILKFVNELTNLKTKN